MIFEILYQRSPKRGWHVTPNRLNGAQAWFSTLRFAISYCEHCGAKAGGRIMIRHRDGSIEQRPITVTQPHHKS